MSANSIAEGLAESQDLQFPEAEGTAPLLDLEDPARAWCDLVEACKLPANSMKKNDAIKDLLTMASYSKWTHELLDDCEADTVDAEDLDLIWGQGNQEALPGYGHEDDCECKDCFKSRVNYFAGREYARHDKALEDGKKEEEHGIVVD